MAEAEGGGDKTEAPSGRKLAQARQRGQVAQSREVNTWFMLMAGTGIVLFMAPGMARDLVGTVLPLLSFDRFIGHDGIQWNAVSSLLERVALIAIMPLLVALVAAFAGTVLQIGLVFATEKLSIDISRLSPLTGFTRLFSIKSGIEFFKNLIKVSVVAWVAAWVAFPKLSQLDHMIYEPIDNLPNVLYKLLLHLLLGVVAVLTALAMFDYAYQRFSFLQEMRMSKQEVKEEHKQSEGDPVIRARLRAIRMNRARKRMMAAVPKASVIITNPTHYAVALQYEMGEAGAPKVVAKGADLIAAKIREIAKEHDVPIVENPPLARALYANVEIDREIPAEHYKAVAEVISYVFRLKGKMRPQAGAAR
jgi:flagellar biosynthetic protein FlhB